MLEQIDTRDVEVAFERGDSLLLYTDGLTDAGAPVARSLLEELRRQLAASAPATPAALVERLVALARERSAVGCATTSRFLPPASTLNRLDT